MTSIQRLHSMNRGASSAALLGAWEHFVSGHNDISGVRPEVAISWHRCRDQYQVDPHLKSAPVAVAECSHPLEHDVVFTELGFRAASIAHELAQVGGVVVIADATGRVLAEWGDKNTREMAAESGLAPWFCWSESAVGTNGMGTALGTQHPIVIRRAEHWAQAFHDWTCAGVAVRDVVTKEPVAVLNISCWREDLPAAACSWLSNAASHTQKALRMRARDGGAELLAAYTQARSRCHEPLAAVDTAGKVVIADDQASVLLGVPAHTPAVDPAVRWVPQLPSFTHAAKYATQQASHNPAWSGSTQIYTHLANEPSAIGIAPVFHYGHLVGHVITFGVSDSDTLPAPEPSLPGLPAAGGQPRRVVALRENRIVPLRLAEVAVAESDGNDVWLCTDQGRLRAAAQGLDKLDHELCDVGFLRVHRSYVVNMNRVREIERRDKGELMLVMDDKDTTMVPVSRRNVRTVRHALGI